MLVTGESCVVAAVNFVAGQDSVTSRAGGAATTLPYEVLLASMAELTRTEGRPAPAPTANPTPQ